MLARRTEFPASRDDVIRTARQRKHPGAVLSFLCLFDAGDKFESRLDFMNRCEEVKLLIREKRAAPKEFEYNRQD